MSLNTEIHPEILEDLAANAGALLASFDYYEELKILKVPAYNITKKRLLTKEFKSLYLALWHFALHRPFGENSQIIYDYFLTKEWIWEKKNRLEILSRSDLYYEKLHERGKEDFTEIARSILSSSVLSEEEIKKLVLKLALLIRSRYTFLFENLNANIQ